jgi:hypothetical protein
MKIWQTYDFIQHEIKIEINKKAFVYLVKSDLGNKANGCVFFMHTSLFIYEQIVDK